MRRENWRSALIAYIDDRTGEPFAYGVNDCLLMVAGAVAAMTGVDHAGPFRGRYSSLAEGRRLIGMSLTGFVGRLFPEIVPATAGDGDIGAVRVGREWGFGIFSDAHLFVQTETGMGILPRSDARKAFRVD